MKNATIKDFQAVVLDSQIPVVVDFWAPWCAPCLAMAPVLDRLTERYSGQVEVVKVNVDEEPALANQFQVQAIPTLHIFRGGQVIDTVIGLETPGSLAALFDQLAGNDELAERRVS